MAEQISGRVRLPKGFDSQTESVIAGTLVIQQGALAFPDGTSFTSSIDTSIFVTTSSFNSFTATYNTGSFSGSFKGDGSQLTGITATVNTSSLVTTSSFNSYTASINSFTASYNTGSFSGSFIGTASYSLNSELLQGVGLSSIAQVDQQNTFTQTNTFRESTYYQADNYRVVHKAIPPALCTQAITSEIFNVYDYIEYTTTQDHINATAIFTYNLLDTATGKSIQGGQALMVWSPSHSSYSTIIDTSAPVLGGSVTLGITDTYDPGLERVVLTVTNNTSGDLLIKGLLTIV